MGWNPFVSDYSKRNARGIMNGRSSLHGPWPTTRIERSGLRDNGNLRVFQKVPPQQTAKSKKQSGH